MTQQGPSSSSAVIMDPSTTLVNIDTYLILESFCEITVTKQLKPELVIIISRWLHILFLQVNLKCNNHQKKLRERTKDVSVLRDMIWYQMIFASPNVLTMFLCLNEQLIRS